MQEVGDLGDPLMVGQSREIDYNLRHVDGDRLLQRGNYMAISDVVFQPF